MMDQHKLADQTSSTHVSLTIDGQKITAAPKQTVLEAANANGIYIPTLCYLKELSPIGSCRVCLVEVGGADHPLAACQLPVAEGMHVTTQSERLRELRKSMVQLILVNHPLDCPVCERSGECRLQNLTYELGIAQQVFKTAPIERQKHTDWKVVRYNPNLCVMCERCIHACNEIQGVAALRVNYNGYQSVVDTHDGRPLDCDFCGRCISVCPVGALSSGLKLQARSWEFEKIKTVCPFCGTGCAIELDVKKDRIFRVSSDSESGINQGNLCGKGRFGFQFIESPERLQTPLIRKNGSLVEASWDEALSLIAERLQNIKKENGGQAIAGIGSERLPNEDNFLFQKFFKKVLGSNRLDNLRRMNNPDVNALYGDMLGSSDDLLKSDLILTIGVEPAEENPVIGNLIRRAMHHNNATLITLFDRQVRFKPVPDLKLIHTHGHESELIQGISRVAAAEDPAALGVKDIAGVAKEAIINAGLKFKHAERTVILCGRQSATGDVLSDLQALCGIAEAKIIFYSEYCNSRGVHDMGVQPDSDADIFESALSGKLKALYIMGEDLLSRYRSRATAQNALQKIEFLVVQDMFLTPTAAMAQVVLPTAGFAEREGTFTNMEGRVQKLRKAVAPRGNVRADWQILTILGKRLAGDFNYDSAEDIFKEISTSISAYQGMDWAGFGSRGCLAQYGEFKVKTVVKKAISAAEEYNKERPFILLDGNSFFHLGPLSLRSPALLGIEPECYALINPQDARNLDIKDGDYLIATSSEGSLTVKTHIKAKILSGTVFIPDTFENTPVNVLRAAQKRQTRVKISKADKK